MAAVVVEMPDERARRYVDRFEASVQGSNGSRALIVALLKILTICRGDPVKAFALARYFNATKCSPPWDEEREDGPDSLKRKLQEALKFWKPRPERWTVKASIEAANGTCRSARLMGARSSRSSWFAPTCTTGDCAGSTCTPS